MTFINKKMQKQIEKNIHDDNIDIINYEDWKIYIDEFEIFLGRIVKSRFSKKINNNKINYIFRDNKYLLIEATINEKDSMYLTDIIISGKKGMIDKIKSDIYREFKIRIKNKGE